MQWVTSSAYSHCVHHLVEVHIGTQSRWSSALGLFWKRGFKSVLPREQRCYRLPWRQPISPGSCRPGVGTVPSCYQEGKSSPSCWICLCSSSFLASWEKVHLQSADKRGWKSSVNCILFIKNSALCKYKVQHYGFVGPVGERLKMLINGI